MCRLGRGKLREKRSFRKHSSVAVCPSAWAVLQDRGRALPAALRQENGFVGFGVGIMGTRECAEQLGVDWIALRTTPAPR